MLKLFLQYFLYISLVYPIILGFLKNKKSETFKVLVVFILFFILIHLIVHLPIQFNALNVFFKDSNWNWTGKLYSILGSIIFLFLCRKYELKDYFLTTRQNKTFLKKGIILILLFILLEVFIIVALKYKSEWNLDKILFQFTMPGLDEELIYRGILLGLLMKIIKQSIVPYKKFYVNTAILITSLLFGFAHGLFLNDSYEIIFHAYPFIRTTLIGYFWGWLTIKSGSIVLPIICHNLLNGFTTLIRMI